MRKGFNLKIVTEKLVAGIQSFMGDKNIAVIGVSGGVDSALAVALLVLALGKDRVLGLILPYGTQSDINDAIAVCKKFDIDYKIMNIKESVDGGAREYKKVFGIEPDALSLGNLKARTRMEFQYLVAGMIGHARVVGTTNASEYFIGYYTKFGDGGIDFEPLLELLKSGVYALAKHLGVPDCVLKKDPSAGLWPDQTDEKEMGFTYTQLETYLTGDRKSLSDDIIQRISYLHSISEHKRNLPPHIKLF